MGMGRWNLGVSLPERDGEERGEEPEMVEARPRGISLESSGEATSGKLSAMELQMGLLEAMQMSTGWVC